MRQSARTASGPEQSFDDLFGFSPQELLLPDNQTDHRYRHCRAHGDDVRDLIYTKLEVFHFFTLAPPCGVKASGRDLPVQHPIARVGSAEQKSCTFCYSLHDILRQKTAHSSQNLDTWLRVSMYQVLNYCYIFCLQKSTKNRIFVD
jgi:hypothetical protein